ncbi:MAG: hypothetical protein KJ834_03020, partial [Alphaproteobacteria bacterium]|nr:hypothetical protein [Alphaproteobacteria bacterium]
TLCAVLRISQGGVSDQHGPEVVNMILRGLGLNAHNAATLAAKPLPQLDIQSACSLMRSTSHAQG